MKASDLKQMYGSTPESFQLRVSTTLARCRAQEPQKARRPGLRVLLVTALLLMLTIAAAVAAFSSQVAEWFGWFYGERMRDELLSGSIAPSGQSIRLGDVIYTLNEVTYVDDGLYGVGHITPAEEGLLLMAEDYQVTDAAGYSLYPNDEAPAGAQTYAGLAREKRLRLVMPTAVPEAVGVDEDSLTALDSFGYTYLPQRDGSIRFLFEIPVGSEVEAGTLYAIQLWLSNWEITPAGKHLRGGEHDTYQYMEWVVTVAPQPGHE